MRALTHILLLTLLLTGCSKSNKQSTRESPLKTWESYLGDNQRTHFSELTEINKENVSQMQLLWTYESGGLKDDGVTQIQTNPTNQSLNQL